MSPLMRACEGSKVGIMTFLIQNGADIQQENRDGRTPIYFVSAGAEKSCDAAYELLLQHGANINHLDKVGLMSACCFFIFF
jgi:ankyrin repeat protein